MTNEPAVTIGAITTAVAAVIALVVAFGVEITEDQSIAILAAIATIGPIVAAYLTRARVTPWP
jgi:hypothetical protein